MTKALPFVQEATGPNVTTLRWQFKTPTSWEGWMLVTADWHIDHPQCRRDMLARHLREAVDRGAAVAVFGDLFCAMQGKFDKRADKRQISPAIFAQILEGRPYLDAIVEDAAAFLEPYARNIAIIGDGNHETAISSRHEVDLNERLVALLNSRTGSRIQHTGYSGWARLMFQRINERMGLHLWYIHGYGGGGPVTQDMIQAQRQRAYVHGADIMVNGHTHDLWTAESIGISLNHAGRVEHKRIHQIKTATYKDEYADGRGGWHVATGKPPKPLGSWWLRFTCETQQQDGPQRYTIKTQVIRAD